MNVLEFDLWSEDQKSASLGSRDLMWTIWSPPFRAPLPLYARQLLKILRADQSSTRRQRLLAGAVLCASPWQARIGSACDTSGNQASAR
jgi:hypothetical protein